MNENSIETGIKTGLNTKISRRGFLRLGSGFLFELLMSPAGDIRNTTEAEVSKRFITLNQNRAELERVFNIFSQQSLPPVSLRNDIEIAGFLEEIPQTQEVKPPTEEEKKEITRLHQELKEYYQSHPEIKERVERTRSKLGKLGFEDDPTPTGVFLRASMIDHLSRLPSENLIRMVSEGSFTLERVREYSEKLTGKNKQRFLGEAKETKYWQPKTKDEEIVLEMVQETISRLFGNKSGYFISEVYFRREESFKESKDSDGSTNSKKELEFFIADNFKQADDNASELLGVASSLVQGLKDHREDLEKSSHFWKRASENNDIKNLLVTILETDKAVLELVDYVIKTFAEQKAGDASHVLRHEIGHLDDPLLFGYDFYSFEEELDSLELITDYLHSHKELVRLPADYQGERTPRFLWREVFDISHTAWADILTAATAPDWLAGDIKVTPEQRDLVNKILAKAGLGLDVERIKDVFQKAYQEAVAKMTEDYRRKVGYQELNQIYQEIETLARQFIPEWKPTAIPILTPTKAMSLPKPGLIETPTLQPTIKPPKETQPLDFPPLLLLPPCISLGLLGIAWIIRRRIKQSK